MSLFKIISCCILLVIITVLLADYIKTAYSAKKNKNTTDTDNKNEPEKAEEDIVTDTPLKIPVVEESKIDSPVSTSRVNNENDISNQDIFLPATDPEKLKDTPTTQALVKRASSLYATAAVTFFVFFVICVIWCNNSVDEKYTLGNPLALFLAFFMFSLFIIQIKQLIYLSSRFNNPYNYLIDWSYPNGDKIILTRWGLIKYNAVVPKLSTSLNFDGFKWGFDNVKDLTESLVKSEGNPLTALLPSIEFSTKSNRIDDYIPFSFFNTVNVTFVEKDRGYMIIQIKKKSDEYSLTYPLPPQKKSLRAEAENFENKNRNKTSPVEGLYMPRSVVNEIMSEKEEV